MIPNGWDVLTLEEIASVERGKFSARPRNDPKYFGGETPFVQTGDIAASSTYIDTYSQTLNEEGVGVSRIFPKDTILITIAANIGDTAITAFDMACPDSLVGIQPYDNIADPYWLKKVLETHKQHLDTKATQNAQKNINLQVLKPLSIKVPPFPEQRKIAKILATWDKAIATTEKLIAASQQQKKALMQQLLTGKKRLTNPETGQPFDGEWEEVKIGDICKVKGGKRLPKGESLQSTPNAHPYIRVADMFMGGVDCKNILYVPECVAASIRRYTISSSDLFITVAGTLGLIGKVPSTLDGANLTENADKLTDIKCDSCFLMYVLMSPVIQKHIEAESTQNAQPKLALTRIRGFRFLLPESEEQQKIAAVLTAADKEIEVQQAKLAHLKQEKKALMQQLLTGKRRVTIDEQEVA